MRSPKINPQRRIWCWFIAFLKIVCCLIKCEASRFFMNEFSSLTYIQWYNATSKIRWKRSSCGRGKNVCELVWVSAKDFLLSRWRRTLLLYFKCNMNSPSMPTEHPAVMKTFRGPRSKSRKDKAMYRARSPCISVYKTLLLRWRHWAFFLCYGFFYVFHCVVKMFHVARAFRSVLRIKCYVVPLKIGGKKNEIQSLRLALDAMRKRSYPSLNLLLILKSFQYQTWL